MNKMVYSNPELMNNIVEIKRFIDDGADCFTGTTRQFTIWIDTVNEYLHKYGLNIAERSIKNPGQYVSFLDIQFCFDNDGQLQTDLFIKETDSRSYLHFSSAHPNHIYSGIVYSQCLRLRRIINSQTRLEIRIAELCESFKNANFPKNMISNISNKVLKMERNIQPKPPAVTNPNKSFEPIRVVSCFKTDTELVKIFKSAEQDLKSTKVFEKIDDKLFTFIKKTTPSLGNKLSTVRCLALGNKFGPNHPCNCKGCTFCKLISPESEHVINGVKVKTAPGTCESYNLIYLGKCSLCTKFYVGRTIQQIRTRVNGHRATFYKIIKGDKLDIDSAENDEFSLGLHLFNDHNLTIRDDFNKYYTFSIVENCNPSKLEVQEHKWIHKLNTIYPKGINRVNPFDIDIFES